jgi:hypothetical protein
MDKLDRETEGDLRPRTSTNTSGARRKTACSARSENVAAHFGLFELGRSTRRDAQNVWCGRRDSNPHDVAVSGF